jgi:hypothetical protein
MANKELGEFLAATLRHLRDSLEVLLARHAGAKSSSMDAGSSDSFLNACSPPAGTYRKSPSLALIQRSPLNSSTVPNRMKKDSEIVRWKWVLGR